VAKKNNTLKLFDTDTNQNVSVEYIDYYVPGGTIFNRFIKPKYSAAHYKIYLDKKDSHKVLYQRIRYAGIDKDLSNMAKIRIFEGDRKNLPPPPETAWLKGVFKNRRYNDLVYLSHFESTLRWAELFPFVNLIALPLDNLSYAAKVHELRKKGRYPFKRPKRRKRHASKKERNTTED
jgi:hypothetical protein